MPAPKQMKKDHAKLSGHNGADEDEIMEKTIKKFSDFARDSTNNKTNQRMLSKKKARRVGEIVLEATHKLTHAQVPAWMKNNFQEAWEYFDQNNEGWIRYEEAHTFLKHLMGPLNKLTAAPGSIADLTSGGAAYPLAPEAELTPVGDV